MSETIELLERLVAIDSVNPTLVPGGAGELEIARFVSRWLEQRGVEAELEELAPGRANVVGRVRGSGGGRRLLLNAHLDTVGLAGPDGGVTPRVEGGRMYGRGTQDMKGSLAAIMIAAAEAAKLDLSGELVVTAVADEEAESIGSERVASTVTADFAIVAEPTDLRVAIAHRGFVWLELETRGRAAHGSRYDLGVDANALMGPALAGIGELDRNLGANGNAHPLLGRASAHVALVEGGTEASTYAARCVAKVERRTLPGETVASVEEEMRGVAGAATVTTLFSREPLETSRDEEIVDVLCRHAGDVLGEAPEIVGAPFWTDAALFSAAGIPTIVFGPRGGGLHEPSEWVELDDVDRLADILVRVAAEICG